MPKFRAIAVLLAAGASLAACVAVVPLRSPTTTTRTVATPVSAVSCDDGGSGGVLIDGVCL